MELILKGEPKEIAALVAEVQERREKKAKIEISRETIGGVLLDEIRKAKGRFEATDDTYGDKEA